MPKKFPSAADCKRSAARTDDIVPALVTYADRKRLLTGVLPELEALDAEYAGAERLPREWKESAATMLALLPVVTVPRRVAGAVRSTGDHLTKLNLDLIRVWRRVPWAFVAFETVEVAEHDIVLVSPIGPPPAGWPSDLFWRRLPVFSPRLADLARTGFRSGLVLVFWDGSVFHTYGMILTFQGFDGKDLQFFASAIDDADDAGEGIPFLAGVVPGGADRAPGGDAADADAAQLPVSDIIRDHPLPFLRLFEWQHVPVPTGRGGIWTFSASMIAWTPHDSPLGAFDPADQASWNRFVQDIQDFIVDKSGAVGFRIASDSPMYDPLVVYSEEDGVLFLRAMTDEAYARGLRAVAALAAFPQYPDVRASLSMRAIAQQILAVTDVLVELERVVTPADDAERERGSVGADGGTGPNLGEISMEQIQPVLNLLMESHNEGKNFSDQEIAARTGVTQEQVRLLREQTEGIFNRVDAAHPAPDRFGLAPKRFHALFSNRTPYAEGVFALKDLRAASLAPEADALLAATPIIRFTRWVVAQGKLPATGAGYVSPGTVRTALEMGIVPRYFTGPEDSPDPEWELSSHGDDTSPPPRKEREAVVFHHYRMILETAKAIRLQGNAFSVNPDVADAFSSTEAPVAPLYHRLAQGLFENVPWDMPRYGSPLPYLRESAGFLLYALEKLSRSEGADADGWVNADRLVDVFLGAHPGLTGESEEDAARARYWGRFHMDAQFGHHLCAPLGIVEVRRTGLTVMMRPTPVFRSVFDVGE